MAREIIAAIGLDDTRVAVLEDGILVEMAIELPENQGIVGNIYKGSIANILPGMQSAFVNIGLEKNAFLHERDIVAGQGADRNIAARFKPGQPILVQVVKDMLGTKGPRVTTHFTLPGRYLVLMPNVDYIGVSRRIEDEEERGRLRALAETIKPPGMGVIIRTVAAGKSAGDLAADVRYLETVWQKITKQAAREPAPCLLYQDVDLITRIVRDYLTPDTDKFVIDDQNAYTRVREMLEQFSPELAARVHFFEGNRDLFEFYGLEKEIARLAQRKIWLKCGGYIIIDEHEALTAIDVNTGKYVGHDCLEETVLKTNLEAAEEIARQLRLRDIGGIIVIDFIDMDTPAHQQQVLTRLQACLKKDRTKSNVLGLTQLGLVEMTRKKARPGIGTFLLKDCPCCDGRGKILSTESIVRTVKWRVQKMAVQHPQAATLIAEVHPEVAAALVGDGGNISRWEHQLGKKVVIRANSELSREEIRLQAQVGGRGCRPIDK